MTCQADFYNLLLSLIGIWFYICIGTLHLKQKKPKKINKILNFVSVQDITTTKENHKHDCHDPNNMYNF